MNEDLTAISPPDPGSPGDRQGYIPDRATADRMTPIERYHHDPVFHALVHALANQLALGNVTEAGLVDASYLAMVRHQTLLRARGRR